MAITLRQLEYFTTVADDGTVTGAAARLYVSQSAVSTAIAELENTLRVTLFVRHARGLYLTREGTAVLARARKLLRDAADLERDAARLTQELTGTLHIGCYSTLAPIVVPRVTDYFAQNHPAVRVDFTEGSRSDLLKGLSLGTFDVVLLYDYTFKKDLKVAGRITKLGSLPPYLILPLDHRLAGQPSVDLAELAADDLILLGLEPADEYFLSLFEQRGLKPKVRYRTPSFEVLRGMVARGLGYSLLTQRVHHSASHEGVPYATADIAGQDEELGIIAVTSESTTTSTRLNAFLSAAKEAVRGAPEY